MKPGEKYIIEIDRVVKGPRDIAFVKGFNALVFDQYGIDHLERYDDKKVRKTIDNAVDAAYKRGMSDTWDMIQTMYKDMTIGELRRIFDFLEVETKNVVMDILVKFPVAEVKKRLDAYEKEKAENEKYAKEMRTIVPGDEVKFKLSDVTIIVTKVEGDRIFGFDKYGMSFSDKRSCNWEKTGRAFNLDSIFKFLGRKDDGPEL